MVGRLATHPASDNPVLTADQVRDCSHVLFVADPFVVHDGCYHLFFEVKRHDRWPGFGLRDATPRFDVGHATSEDGRRWTYEGVVLPASQAEHTYPHVFRYNDEWHMAPSPAGATPSEFRLYRARSFPREWTLVSSALSGEVRIDPTPFEYDDRWFLVYQEARTYDVRLQHAERLDGAWREHPASPLFTPGGNEIAPGGRPLVHDDGVELFFRRGTPGIVEHWWVKEPSEGRFEMRELDSSPILSGEEGNGWNSRNMHHVDAGLVADGHDVVAVDGQDETGEYRIGIYTPA